MALVTGSIPNLVGGISQQHPALRATTQAENIENCECSIVRGLSKRRPLTWKYSLHAHKNLNDSYYFINRDETERYILHIRNGTLSVFELEDGTPTNISADSTLHTLFPEQRFESTWKRDDEDYVRWFDIDIVSNSINNNIAGEYGYPWVRTTKVDLTSQALQHSEVRKSTEATIVKLTDDVPRVVSYETVDVTKWTIKGTYEHQNLSIITSIQKSATEDFASSTHVSFVAVQVPSSTKQIVSIDISFTPDTAKPWIRIQTSFIPNATGPKVYRWYRAPLRYETAERPSTAFDASSHTEVKLRTTIWPDRSHDFDTSTVTIRWEKSATEDFSSATTIETSILPWSYVVSERDINISYTVDSDKPWIRAVLTDITSGFVLLKTFVESVGTDTGYLQTNENHSLKFLTIADHTFIVNPSVIVKESTVNSSNSVGDLLIYTPTALGGHTDIGLTLGTVKGSLSDNYDEESSSEIWGLLMNEFIIIT